MVVGSEQLINLINDNVLSAKALADGKTSSQNAFNRFFKATQKYLAGKYNLNPDVFDNCGESKDFVYEKNKIIWNQQEEVSIGEFIFCSLKDWIPEKSSYLSFVSYLLKDCKYLVPQYRSVYQAKNKQFRDILKALYKIQRIEENASIDDAINVLYPDASYEDKTFWRGLFDSETSLNQPIESSDDPDSELTVEDTIEDVDRNIDSFNTPEDCTLQLLDRVETLFTSGKIGNKSKSKISLYFTVELIKHNFKYVDFSFYKDLSSRYECIFDDIAWIEAIYEENFKKKFDSELLFPTQKQQAEKLGVTASAFNQSIKNFEMELRSSMSIR